MDRLLRSNYYMGETQNKLYVGAGIYQTKKAFSYGYNNHELSGDISAHSATLLIGYAMLKKSGFNLNIGAGGLYFLNKSSDVTVSDGSTQTVISSGVPTQFLIEGSLGYMF